jgi:hypothetical protein
MLMRRRSLTESDLRQATPVVTTNSSALKGYVRDRYCWRTYFNTTKSGFLQRLLQSLGAFKQAIGEATFQRFQVRQQYPSVFGTAHPSRKRPFSETHHDPLHQ